MTRIESIYFDATALSKAGKIDEAAKLYNFIIDNFKDIKSESNEVLLVYSMLNLGVEYATCGKFESSHEVHNRLIELYADHQNEEIRRTVLKAMKTVALNYQRTGNIESALKVREKIVSNFKDSLDKDTQKVVLNSLGILSLSYIRLKDINKTMSTFEKILDFTKIDKHLCEIAAISIFSIALCLAKSNFIDEAILVNKNLISNFKDSDNKVVLEQVAKSMYNLGLIYDGIGQQEMTKDVYQDFLVLFGDSDIKVIKKIVSKIKEYKGKRDKLRDYDI